MFIRQLPLTAINLSALPDGFLWKIPFYSALSFPCLQFFLPTPNATPSLKSTTVFQNTKHFIKKIIYCILYTNHANVHL